jgi:CubicO group peptidase (beta-lactamase class C family)
MGARFKLSGLFVLAAAAIAGPAAAQEPAGLHEALSSLAEQGMFSGAVVIRGPDGVHFARGYGWADPFERRAFTPDTPADSGSLAKPITSAAVLLLVAKGRIELDSPVQLYLSEYPHALATVRHLLSHSAGLDMDESPEALANKNNAQLLAGAGTPRFSPGSAFAYCNLCSIALALLIERVTGVHYLDFVRERIAVPPGVALRPQRLGDWTGRAIGFRRNADGEADSFDSWEGELLYGAANFSITASQLAQWGSEWWQARLAPIAEQAGTPARIGGGESGLTLGNWYCAQRGRQCHYLGHHEGFRHLLYRDSDRRISIAMLSNNSLAPELQQRLQRALVAFARAEPERARSELGSLIAGGEMQSGRFRLPSGEIVEIAERGEHRSVRRGGVDYAAYPISSGIRYAPGLDLYVAGADGGRLQWLTLYEDVTGTPAVD